MQTTKQFVTVVNPREGWPKRIEQKRAMKLVNHGQGKFLPDGQLELNPRISGRLYDDAVVSTPLFRPVLPHVAAASRTPQNRARLKVSARICDPNLDMPVLQPSMDWMRNIYGVSSGLR